jgi:predicted Zn-dependent protease
MYETQADRCGLSLMERAGFDPREGAKIWEILHQEASMEDKMNENDLLKKFTNKGSRMFLSLYNSHPETLQRYRNTNLLMALNYQEKDFSLDKKRYEQQTIEYRNFKLKLEHLLKLTKHSKEAAPTAKQQSNRVQEKVKSEEPAKGKTGLLDRIDKIKKTIK